MRHLIIALLITSFGLFTACDDSSSSGPDFTGEETVYQLSELNSSGVSGTATFVEIEGGTTLVVVQLSGTPADGSHPAHIHMNTAAEGGGIAISLEAINGSNGLSETTIETTDAGDVITYDELVAYDGYINVHLSAQDLGTVVAQGDIGGNAFTGSETQYALEERNSTGVSGTVTFLERVNGSTLGVIELSGTPQGGMHPAHIHENSASQGGGIAVSFNTVDGDTGMSRTQIDAKDDGTSLSYDDIVSYNGYVNVHLSPDDLGTIVAQGNIGSNSSSATTTTTGSGSETGGSTGYGSDTGGSTGDAY